MLTIRGEAAEPYWLPLDPAAALRVQVRPMKPVAAILGRQAAQRALLAGGAAADAEEAYTLAVAVWAIQAWEGVGDDEGEPVPVSATAVVNLLSGYVLAYEAFDRGYVLPALQWAAEKNASSVAPPGGSATADTAIAPPAKSPAKPAPSASKRRKPKTA